jgi:hypothetical protein
MLFLLRRLVREPQPVILTTARRGDLALVDLAARGSVPPDHVFLYFHWFRESPGKLSFLRRMAARQPDIVILGTTDSVVDVFRRCGFCESCPCRIRAVPAAADAGLSSACSTRAPRVRQGIQDRR